MFKKMMKTMKERWECDHVYKYIRAYHREPYSDDQYCMVYPLGFIVKCKKCGKKKDVGKDWCKWNYVEDMPKVAIRTRK